MIRRVVLFAAVLGVLPGVVHAEDKPKVAVLPFESPNDHSLGMMGPNAVESFTHFLIDSGKVRVFEREKLERIMKEHELSMTGLIDPSTIKKEIGQLVQVDFLVQGKINFEGDAFTLTVRAIDLATAEMTASKQIPFRETSGLRIAVKQGAEQLVAAMTGGKAETSKSGLFLNVDPRDFYDSASYLVKKLEGIYAPVSFDGAIKEYNAIDGDITLEKKAGRKLFNGQRLVVARKALGDKERIALIYIGKEPDADTPLRCKVYQDEISEGQIMMGDSVTTKNYKPKVAVGVIADEVEDNTALVEQYRKVLIEKLGESDAVEAADHDDLAKRLDKLKDGPNKKELQKLHKKGVDFYITGKFFGQSGSRRAEMTIYNTFDGKKFDEVKLETRL